MSTRAVVEWTRASVRLAVSEGGGVRWRLRAVHSRPVKGSGIAPLVRELLADAGGSVDEAVVVVPREQVITRLVKFPSTDPAELAQMAELYAKAQLPYARDQAVVDFHVLRQEEGFSTVAIVACQRDVADRHLAVAREAGLPSATLTVSSWGVLGWFRLAGGGAGEEPILVVNVDDTRTDFVLVQAGRIVSSRSIGQGARDWQALGETAELLGTEVERTRTALRKELPGAEARSVILTGAGMLVAWREPLAQRLAVPVAIIESAQGLQGVELPEASAISPVVVAGLASDDASGWLNLSPSEARVQLRDQRQWRELVTVSVMAVGVLLLGAALLGIHVVRHQRLVGRLDAALQTVEPAAQQLRAHTESARLVRELFAARRRFAATLAGILHTTPPPVTLESVAVERARREIVLRGSAASTQAVLDYVQQLRQLDGVAGVDLKYSTGRSTPAGDRTDFELMLREQQEVSS